MRIYIYMIELYISMSDKSDMRIHIYLSDMRIYKYDIIIYVYMSDKTDMRIYMYDIIIYIYTSDNRHGISRIFITRFLSDTRIYVYDIIIYTYISVKNENFTHLHHTFLVWHENTYMCIYRMYIYRMSDIWYIHIYIRCVLSDMRIYSHVRQYIYRYVYIYICMYHISDVYISDVRYMIHTYHIWYIYICMYRYMIHTYIYIYIHTYIYSHVRQYISDVRQETFDKDAWNSTHTRVCIYETYVYSHTCVHIRNIWWRCVKLSFLHVRQEQEFHASLKYVSYLHTWICQTHVCAYTTCVCTHANVIHLAATRPLWKGKTFELVDELTHK